MNEAEVDDVAFLTGGDNSSAGGGRGRYNESGVAVCSYQRALCVTVLVLAGLLTTALVIAYGGPQNECSCAGKMPPDYVPEDWNVTTTAIPIATNGQPFPWHNIRLPTFVRPLKYNLTIHPNLTTFEVKGVVSIEFNVEKETNFIVVHSKNLSITEKAVQGPKGHLLKIVKFLEYKPTNQLYIEVRDKLRRRANYTLNLRFTRSLSRGSEGLHIDSYEDNNGNKHYLTATYFRPGEARSAYPCFDEPHFRAKIKLFINRDRFHIALCSTPVNATEEAGFYLGTGLLRDEFQEAPPCAPGTVGWLVSDFPRESIKLARGVSIAVYAPKNVLTGMHYMLNSAKNLLEYLEGWLGVDYPLTKLDLVALNSMEEDLCGSWGLLFYHQELLSVPDETRSERQQEVATELSEQIAYQWFGGLVSVYWWNEEWLFKGLIHFLGMQSLASVEIMWPVEEIFVIKHFMPAIWYDALATATPLEATVMDPTQIEDVFDDLSYSKCASLLRMLGGALGEGTLHGALADFLTTNKYQAADQNALWTSFERQLNHTLPIKTMMKTWTQHAGFPLITVTREGTTITATQTKFVLKQTVSLPTIIDVNITHISTTVSTPAKSRLTRWVIPLTYFTDCTNGTEVIWLNNSKSINFTISSESHWLKLNSDQSGFYRVLYPVEYWTAFISLLKTEHKSLTALDRMGLIDDAFVLCRAGLLNCSIPLELSVYLPLEESLGPWQVTLKHLTSWRQRFAEGSPFPMIEQFTRRLLSAKARSLGWIDKGDHATRLLRSVVLDAAVYYGDEFTLTQAKKMFTGWRNNNTKISVNLREVVYAAGVSQGSLSEWQFCWDRYQSIKGFYNSTQERIALLTALGAAQQPWLLYRLLDLSMNRDLVPTQDVKVVLVAVSRNPIGKLLAWRHLKAHWTNFLSEFGNGTRAMAEIIQAVAQDMSSVYDRKELSDLLSDIGSGLGAQHMAQTLEEVAVNVQWVAKEMEPLTDWLENYLKKV